MIAIPNAEIPDDAVNVELAFRDEDGYIVWHMFDIPLIEIVPCGECKYQFSCGQQIKRNGLTLKLTCCEYGERRADYTVFTVNPPKGIETPLKGDATAFHKNSK